MPCCAHIVLAVRFLKCENIIIITPVTFHWGIFCITLFQISCSYSSIFYSSWVPQTCYLSTDGLHKIVVPWNVTPCWLKEKYRRFERIPCLYIAIWRWIEQVPPKRQFLSAKMHYMTFHNTTVYKVGAEGTLFYIFTLAWRLRPVRNISSFSHSHLLASIVCIFNTSEFRDKTFLYISYMLLLNFLMNVINCRW
jgi:hypothetical protein